MRSATQLLCCAVAAVQMTASAWAATSGAVLANPDETISLLNPAALNGAAGVVSLTDPAAEFSQGELFASIVHGANADASADTSVVPSAFDADKAADATCDCTCGSACCDCGSGCGDACCCGSGVGLFGAGCGPVWSGSVGGVVLSRSQPVPAILAEPLVGIAGIRATDFSIGTTVGVDLSIARRLTQKGSLEARYLGAEWDPRAEFRGLTNINLGGINLPGITAIGGGYNSTLDSSEFNWRHRHSDNFSWLVGFRWIELQDTVDFFAATGLGSTSLSWNTNNHLYGGQIGGDYQFWQSSRRPLSVTGSGKFGVFGNVADNDFAQFIGPFRVASGGGFGTEVSLVTELGLWAKYQLSDRWSVRGGGQFLYIDSVAIGSDQVAASLFQGNPNAFDSSGYVYYTGGLFSLDYVW